MKKVIVFIHRSIIHPILRLLRNGASPQRLAWSIAIGAVIGINPLLGSTTIVTIAVIFLLRLNQPAAQLGVHPVYPLQLLLFLPFIHIGTRLFHTEPIPLSMPDLLKTLKEHPWGLTKVLWSWEWHALIIWLAVAIVITPTLAFLLTHILKRAMKASPSQELPRSISNDMP